jgi:hypothetical protein
MWWRLVNRSTESSAETVVCKQGAWRQDRGSTQVLRTLSLSRNSAARCGALHIDDNLTVSYQTYDGLTTCPPTTSTEEDHTWTDVKRWPQESP